MNSSYRIVSDLLRAWRAADPGAPSIAHTAWRGRDLRPARAVQIRSPSAARAGTIGAHTTRRTRTMAGRLDGKVAVITGGGKGIGRAAGRRFLAEGAAVVLADINAETAEETMALARQDGHAQRVHFVRVD